MTGAITIYLLSTNTETVINLRWREIRAGIWRELTRIHVYTPVANISHYICIITFDSFEMLRFVSLAALSTRQLMKFKVILLTLRT